MLHSDLHICFLLKLQLNSLSPISFAAPSSVLARVPEGSSLLPPFQMLHDNESNDVAPDRGDETVNSLNNEQGSIDRELDGTDQVMAGIQDTGNSLGLNSSTPPLLSANDAIKLPRSPAGDSRTSPTAAVSSSQTIQDSSPDRHSHKV